MARNTTPVKLLAALAVAAVLCIGGMGAVSAASGNWTEPINASDGQVNVTESGANITVNATWTNGSSIMVTNEIVNPVDFAINFSMPEQNVTFINKSGHEKTKSLSPPSSGVEVVAFNITNEDLTSSNLSGTLWQTFEWEESDIRFEVRNGINTTFSDDATEITEENITFVINQTIHENSSADSINSSWVEVYDGSSSTGLFTLAGDNAKAAFLGLLAVVGGLALAARKEVI